MTVSRLDRLSALLEGLAPAVSLGTGSSDAGRVGSGNDAGAGLDLYLLTGGTMTLRHGEESLVVRGPSIVVVRSGTPHDLENVPPAREGRLIRARADLTGPVAGLFLDEFPKPRVVPLADDEPALQLATSLIAMELDNPRCGHPALLDRAGGILFIGLLRHLVAHPGAHGSGLFNGLADPRIARALVAMHHRPGFDWTLERLADEAGMSRTAFAGTFRTVMRKTPGRYLSALRLSIAQRAVELGRGLKEAARTSGYRNTSALSRALSKARRSGVPDRAVVQPGRDPVGQSRPPHRDSQGAGNGGRAGRR